MVECKYCHKQFKSNVGLGVHKRSCEGWKNELSNVDDGPYICNCGRQFNKKSSLISHGRFCPLYEKVVKKKTKYLTEQNTYKCECGKEYNNYQSFNAHLSHCNIHHDIMGTTRKLRPSEIKKSMNWENKTAEEIKQIKIKAGKTYSKKYKEGKIQSYWKDKHLPEEMKEKQRIGAISYIKETNGDCKPRYSIKACTYIDQLNKTNNWNLQHAENGGEYNILGYFLDGYDKELNIVFEYDEPKHYIDVLNNILSERDIKRQNYIIEHLNCEFWRYNEKLNLLYKVN